MNDYNYLNKIEEMMEQRRKENPSKQEFDRLVNEIYPIKTINGIYILGHCNALAYLKNDLYKYFCKSDQYIIDEIIRITRDDKDFNEILDKLIK